MLEKISSRQEYEDTHEMMQWRKLSSARLRRAKQMLKGVWWALEVEHIKTKEKRCQPRKW